MRKYWRSSRVKSQCLIRVDEEIHRGRVWLSKNKRLWMFTVDKYNRFLKKWTNDHAGFRSTRDSAKLRVLELIFERNSLT